MKKNFYRAFEDKYRGSRELIRGRLEFYRPFIQPLVAEFGRVPAIDLGCGRGEWLEVMLAAGFDARGIDLDAGMLQACVDLGLPAERGEAITHLRALPSKSQAIVSAFHVVEHIPFDALEELVSEAKRVLLPGGLLILETPNPENITVATCSFYLDPTHQRPIPPNLLSFLAEHIGFERVKVIRLQESKELASRPELQLEDVLGGVSPDYSVVAQKKGKKLIMNALGHAFLQDYGLTLSGLSARYDAHVKGKAGEERLKLMQERFEAEKAALDSRLTTLSSEHSALVTSHSALVAEHEELATRHQILATEREALQQQLHDIHQANHGHWQLAESLKQELAAKEQTWSEERSTLDSRLSTLSSEHSSLVAERNELATRHQLLATRHQLLATERVALASRIEEVAGEAAVARAQSESLRQELAANEQAWSEERSTLDTRLSALLAERDSLATSHSSLVTERDAVLASTCWRITAPIRWMRGGVRIPWPAPNEPLDDFFIKHAALYIRRRPHLKERALQFLFRNPKWHARVLPVLQGIKASTASPRPEHLVTTTPVQPTKPVPQTVSIHESPVPQEPVAPVSATPFVTYEPPADLSGLTPHAQRIYADLKKAIERKNRVFRA